MDSTQMKGKKKKQVQKKAVQRNSANSFGADFSSKGATTAMPRPVQQKMENSFGADFSNVLIHKDSGSATNMGALAYAQGNEVHFAPGQYNPETQKGQELLGHELTHVIQQRQGRVQATTQGKGMAINDDPALEREADAMGAKAARSDYPIQQKSMHENGSTSSKYTDGLNGQERDKKIKGSGSTQQNGRPDLGALGNRIRSYAGSDFSKNMFEHYWQNNGNQRLSRDKFNDIVRVAHKLNPNLANTQGTKVVVNGATLYAKVVDLYQSSEYNTSLGSSTIMFTSTGTAVGFYDYYDFDWKDWGRRSKENELKTRAVDVSGSIHGAEPYNIHYGFVPQNFFK